MDAVTCSDEELNGLQWATIEYYIRESNFRNGLIADKTQPGSPASIAAVGMAHRVDTSFRRAKSLTRAAILAKRVLNRLQFFWSSPQGPEPNATGYKTVSSSAKKISRHHR